MRHFFYLIFGLLLLSSCSTYSEDQIIEYDKKIQSYIAKNNLKCEESSSGLYYRIDTVGSGPDIIYTNEVSFTYRGSFLDGKVFNEQKEPVTFPVRELIAAWQEVMLRMKKGGKAFLIAPPQLGYGSHELDDIPANSILVYELEVVDVN